MMGRRALPYLAAMPLLLPVYVGTRLLQKVGARLATCFTEESLIRYYGFVRIHYGTGGDSYGDVENLSEDQRLAAVTEGPPSRLLPFHHRFPELTRFVDGDSFLELGCGRGNELYRLAKAFPTSRLSGIDINRHAPVLVNGLFGGRIETRSADLGDLSVLCALATDSVDHVLFIHSDHYMFVRGIAATMAYRRALFTEAIRIARKGVVMVRETIAPGSPLRFEMARDMAGVIRDDLTALLLSLGLGDVGAAFTAEGVMVVLHKNRPAEGSQGC